MLLRKTALFLYLLGDSRKPFLWKVLRDRSSVISKVQSLNRSACTGNSLGGKGRQPMPETD